MIVEVHGVNFKNKGAELMLHAIVQQIKELYPDIDLAAMLRCGSFKQRSNAGLKHLAWIDSMKFASLGRIIDGIMAPLPHLVTKKLGMVRVDDLNGILDSSGYAYGDKRGPIPSEWMALKSSEYKRRGIKIILLPQAFGPFDNQRIRNAFRKVIINADLIFARDKISFNHLIGLGVNREILDIAPDFTNLVAGQLPSYFDSHNQQPCIIPNYRMIDSTHPGIANQYKPFIEFCIEYLFENGFEPFILIHELIDDLGFAQEIQTNISYKVNIIQETNPIYLKGIIGHCPFIISSRYHGLVNALSQGIPVLGTGWSHKYQMLLDEYHCPDYLISPTDQKSIIIGKIDELMDPSRRDILIQKIQSASKEQLNLTNKMWLKVKTVLDN